MVTQLTQADKAELFRNQHHSGKLLILPNIWDLLGAKLMEKAGYHSIATASVATALSNGFQDGEKIPFMHLLKTVARITAAVSLPLTVDIERGFADSLLLLKENIRLLIENGAVGLNIEDSHADHKGLYKLDEQCRKIEAIREVGIQCGVPIVINARTDIFLQKTENNAIGQAIERGRAYKAAGADCFYPIVMNDYAEIFLLIKEVSMPVNVLLSKATADLKKLEEIGVARVSLGPGLLNHALTAMKQIADELLHYNTTAFLSRELLPREFMDSLV
jgi:2-methylisocitrate lyase-like PEP mutase family enzyme